MITAKDIMTKELITLSPQDDVVGAAQILLDYGINGAPVINDSGKLVGILCQSDLITQQQSLPVPSFFTLLDSYIPLPTSKQMENKMAKIAATTVEQTMTPNPVCVTPDTALDKVAALMVEKNFHTLPVLEDGKLVGVVGKEDVLRTIVSE